MYNRGSGVISWLSSRRAIQCAVISLAVTLAAFPLGGQSRVVVGDRISCAQCAIELTRVARIGSPDDSIYFFIASTSIAQDSRGRLLLGPREPHQNATVTVYDTLGRYLGAFARPGQGPGEASLPRFFRLTDRDSLYLFDGAKVSVFSPAHRFVRFIDAPATDRRPSSVAILPGGDIVMSTMVSTSSSAGYPLHVVSRDGGILRSFGVDNPIVRPDREYDAWRSVAVAGDSLIWAARANRYLIELWDRSGTLRRSIVRDARWFPPWTTQNEVTPNPMVTSIRQDTRGYLWSVVATPDEKWSAESARRMIDSLRGRPDAPNGFFDTVIEVIDPRTGTLVATRRLPFLASGFWSGDMLISASMGRNDTPYIDVWRVHLRRP